MRFLFSFLLVIGLAVMFVVPTTDTDFGWHLRCGQDFLQSGQFCFQNRYSYFLPDYFWGYSTLVYDLILAVVYNNFGFLGVALSLGLVVGLLATIFSARFLKSETIGLSLFTFLFFSFSVLQVGFRPQIMAYLFFLLSLLLIERLIKNEADFKPWLHILFYLVLVLWVNTHPSFILAVVLYSLFCLFQIFNKRYFYLLPWLLIWLVALINPVGNKVYLELFNHYNTDLSKLIAEWTAPKPILRVGILLTLAPTLVFLWRQKKHLTDEPIFDSLFLLFLGMISFGAKRHLPLYGLFLVFVWEKKRLWTYVVNKLKLPIKLINYSLIALVCFLALDSFSKIAKVKNFQTWYCENALVKQPCRAVKTLKNNSDNIFTMYEWGGYLIWKMPKAKVFVDGRMPAWQTSSGKSPYTIYLEIIQARPGWQQTLAKYQTDSLLIAPGTFLDLELKNNPNSNWKLTKQLDNAVFYKRVKQ